MLALETICSEEHCSRLQRLETMVSLPFLEFERDSLQRAKAWRAWATLAHWLSKPKMAVEWLSWVSSRYCAPTPKECSVPCC